MTLRYGSVCSGIEAATAAWHHMGWEAAFFSEIEKFPCAVLEHHYPDVPLHGDFTTIKENEYGKIDLLVGGTPCQSFSIAGLRGGLDDNRGNLALEFCRLAQREQPRWIVWENVPGVLSSSGGRDFGSILGALEDLGYGLAYRVLDAQYFGVAQRRRRVFVVGYLGDWRPAAAVLFERHSMSGHPAPSRQARQEAATEAATGTGGSGGDGGTRPDLAGPLTAGMHKGPRGTEAVESGHVVAFSSNMSTPDCQTDGSTPTLKLGGHGGGNPPAVAYSIMPMNSGKDYKARETDISQPLMAGGPVGGNQGGDFIITPFDTTQITSPHNYSNPQVGDPCHPLAAGAHPPAVAFNHEATHEVAGTFKACAGSGGWSNSIDHAAAGYMALTPPTSTVRRLTPVECERLQGFPDNFTAIPWRKKGAEDCPDGPRYKALGNSMAVPVMRWIGERIRLVDDFVSII
jgi:DNA (cytosine-5)-methyltransferase 1